MTFLIMAFLFMAFLFMALVAFVFIGVELSFTRNLIVIGSAIKPAGMKYKRAGTPVDARCRQALIGGTVTLNKGTGTDRLLWHLLGNGVRDNVHDTANRTRSI